MIHLYNVGTDYICCLYTYRHGGGLSPIREDASSTGDDNVHWQDDEVSEALWDTLLIT